MRKVSLFGWLFFHFLEGSMQEKRLIIIFILSIIIGVGIIFVIQNKGFIIGENKEKREYLRALNLIEEKNGSKQKIF